jgi:hypothetical protein
VKNLFSVLWLNIIRPKLEFFVRLSFFATVLIIGALLGLSATYVLLAAHWRGGRVDIGGWTTWPSSGIKENDPYTAAHIARSGDMPLGQGEGMVFVRTHDEKGQRLRGRCHYRVSGMVPLARMWTLTLTGVDGIPIANPSNRYSLTSYELLRDAQGNADIDIAPFALPQNWLPMGSPQTSSVAAFQMVLHMYDTPISSATQALTPSQLPEVRRISCL